MASWEEELEQILSAKGVQQEYSPTEQSSSEQELEFSITQLSHTYPGVSYRLDLTDTDPELRVFVPANEGAYKMRIYLVKLAPGSFLLHFLGLLMAFEGGSSAFREIEGGIIYHMLLLVLNAMKALFWQGDLATLCFPPEIEVRCLL